MATNNLAVIIDELSGGGVEKQILNLASSTLNADFNVTIFHKKTLNLELDISDDINIRRLSSWRLIWVFQIISILKSDNIVLSNMKHINIKIGIICLFIKHMAKIIFVEHTYTATSLLNEPWLKSKIIKFFIHKTYSIVPDKIICVSDGVKSGLVDHFSVPENMIEVIYNGIILYKNKYKRDDNEIIKGQSFAFVGRFSKAKNIPFLINAFELVSNKFPDIRLDLYGDGEDHKTTKLLVESKNLSEKIYFRGFQNNPFSQFHENTCLLLTSEWEGFGNVIVEALGAGFPVISSNCLAGPSEILQGQKYGYMYDVGKLDELVVLMTKFIENGLEVYPSRAYDFSIAENSKKYKKVLQSL